MSFRLSQRSMDKLEGVHPAMTGVVERAIQITDVDFGVTQGIRTCLLYTSPSPRD